MRRAVVRLVIVCLVIGFAPRAAVAQAPVAAGPTPLEALRTGAAQGFAASVNPIDYTTVLGESQYVVLLAGRTAMNEMLLRDFEERRSDKQIGTPSSSSGTTTLVSKGTVPKVLGLAVENGAATQSQSGTVMTFRTNVGGALRALADKGYVDLAPRDFRGDAAMAILNSLSASVSFDTARGTGDSPQLTGDTQQVSQWTGRIQLVNHRDPDGRQALDRWSTTLQAPLQAIANAALTFAQAADRDPALRQWAQDTAAAIEAQRLAPDAAHRQEAITKVLIRQEDRFPSTQALTAATSAAIGVYDQAGAVFLKERNAVLSEVSKGALASFEYTNDRPLKTQATHNFRLIGEVGGSVELTGNASLTLFDKAPASGGSIRDYELSGQMDVHLGSPQTTGGFVFSVAGKWIDQRQDTLDTSGMALPDTAGTWKSLQAKLLIPVKGSGTKIPLSVTWANRNELIKEKHIVRANVGVTYDLDMLFAKFKPF